MKRNNFMIYISEFGFELFLIQFIIKVANKLKLIKMKEKMKDKKNKLILNILYKEYQTYIEKYNLNEGESKENNIVWIFWWQGIKEAPEIVQSCIKSAERCIHDKKIIIIDKTNVEKYYKIPEFLKSRLQNNEISITHFSDILRVNLLRKYGGYWVDSTLFFTDNPIKDTNFCTVKFNDTNEHSIAKGKWCIFFFGGNNQPLYEYLVEVMEEYWKRHKIIIDYFMTDYFIRLAYEKCKNIRNKIDAVEINNENIYLLQDKLSKKFDSKEFENIKTNSIHKLSYKKKINIEDKNNYYNIVILGKKRKVGE